MRLWRLQSPITTQYKVCARMCVFMQQWYDVWQTYQINKISLKIRYTYMHMLIKKQCITLKICIVCINAHFGTISLFLSFTFFVCPANSIQPRAFVNASFSLRGGTVYNISKWWWHNNNYNNNSAAYGTHRDPPYYALRVYSNEQRMTDYARAHWMTRKWKRKRRGKLADWIWSRGP